MEFPSPLQLGRDPLLTVEDENATVTWVTGNAPSARPDMLRGQFAYDAETGSPQGGVYGYYLASDGSLRYACVQEGGDAVLILPGDCAVGVSFTGELGESRILAVNYSGSVGGAQVQDAIVVECASGYAFYAPDKGLLLLQTGMEGGEVLRRIVSDEADGAGIYASFVE